MCSTSFDSHIEVMICSLFRFSFANAYSPKMTSKRVNPVPKQAEVIPKSSNSRKRNSAVRLRCTLLHSHFCLGLSKLLEHSLHRPLRIRESLQLGCFCGRIYCILSRVRVLFIGVVRLSNRAVCCTLHSNRSRDLQRRILRGWCRAWPKPRAN